MIRGETIWITGASSGIGAALVAQLSSAGNNILMTARNAEKLQHLRAGNANIHSFPGDITNANELLEISDSISAKFGGIDRVIVNAGTCEYFDVNMPDWEMPRRVMEVNFFGAINTIAAAIPLLQQAKKRKPHIVVVASMASVVPFPRSEAYGASKAALQYFCESLRIDLADQKIAVTIVQPGFVDTPLTEKNDFPMPFLMTVEDAAKAMVERLEKFPHLVKFPSRLGWLLYFFRCFPKLWTWLAINKLSRTSVSE